MDKKVIKFDDTEIKEYQFHQYRSPILINAIDINKIVTSNKFLFGKQDLKIIKKLKLYVYFFQNRMHI